MFFSAHEAETNRRVLSAAGFGVLQDEIVELREPEQTVSFLRVPARKSAAP